MGNTQEHPVPDQHGVNLYDTDPDLGVSHEHAREMAAYLATLR